MFDFHTDRHVGLGVSSKEGEDVGAAEGASDDVGDAVVGAEVGWTESVGVSEGTGVGEHVSAVTPHDVDAQPESVNASVSVAVTPHQPRSLSKDDAP